MNGIDNLGFQGKRVLVTGASSGIGRAIAIELSRLGASIILVGRDEERLAETSGSLEKGDHSILCLDLRDHAAIFPQVKEVAEQGGRVYGMCHAAGVVDTKPLGASNVKSVQSILDVNLIAGLEMARVICRRDVMEEEGGSLLFVASIYGLIGMPGETAYSASKGGLLAAVRTLAVELARRKIRVNALSPGFVKTAMTENALSKLSAEHAERIMNAHPLGVGTPEDVARAAGFLLAPANSWITGTNLVVDGGFTAQ